VDKFVEKFLGKWEKLSLYVVIPARSPSLSRRAEIHSENLNANIVLSAWIEGKMETLPSPSIPLPEVERGKPKSKLCLLLPSTSGRMAGDEGY
jgi:hypothetical protein